MGYICIGATDSKENIVMFKDSDNCELLDDVITAKCKLSGSKIANFNKDTNSPMLYICEFIREYKDYDEQFYSRVL